MFIGLIVAVGLLVSSALTFNVFFANGIRDLLFVPQFAILAVVYFLVFPVIMVLISNIYFKTGGKKIWGNWLKIAVNYNSVFTVIAVYQCAFSVIEILVFCTINYASDIVEKIGTIYNMTAYHEKKKLFYFASNCPGYEVLVQRFKDEGVHIDW